MTNDTTDRALRDSSTGETGVNRAMDVLAQALNVAEQADACQGSVTLVFDLDNSAHRAAYAAAIAVLRISGIDEDALIGATTGNAPPPQIVDAQGDPFEGMRNEQNAQLLRTYADAMTELTTDEARRDIIIRETFPRVVELIRDGANVEAVAQIQYRRWVEENLDMVRKQ
jgi:hypothetical protein